MLYPNTEGKKFDMAYYCNQHIPMVKQKLGAACKGICVDQGLGGVPPGSGPAFTAMAHLSFDSVETFQATFGPHAEAIMGDAPTTTGVLMSPHEFQLNSQLEMSALQILRFKMQQQLKEVPGDRVIHYFPDVQCKW